MRFSFFYIASLLAIPSIVSAVSITSGPLAAHAGDSVSVTWTNGPADPKWTVFLVNATYFPNLYQAWYDIDASAGSAQFDLRSDLQPGSDYQFRFVRDDWVDFVLTSGAQFSIVP